MEGSFKTGRNIRGKLNDIKICCEFPIKIEIAHEDDFPELEMKINDKSIFLFYIRDYEILKIII